MQHKVFVYGTLKTGYRLHGILAEFVEEGEAKFVTKATLAFSHMVSLGPYPAAILRDAGQENWIQGEVFAVNDDCLHRLDMTEGYPRFYNRGMVTVNDNEGLPEVCWIYHLTGRLDSVELYEIVEGGYWRDNSGIRLARSILNLKPKTAEEHDVEYKRWLEGVNKEVMAMAGVSLADLGDNVSTRDMFDDGVPVYDAAMECLGNDDLGAMILEDMMGLD